MSVNPLGIHNILVVRNDRFGEFLLNIPAFRALKETFTNARIAAVVSPYVKILAEAVPFIDEVIEWNSKECSLLAKIKLICVLRSKKIDIALMFNPSRDFNFITWAAGVPTRAGYDRKLGFLLNRRITDKKYLEEMHEVEYNLALAGLVRAKTDDKSLCLNVARDFPLALAQDNLIAIHPWTSDAIKQWPYSNFVALAEKLKDELNATVVIVGDRSQAIKSQELFGAKEGKRLINLTGKTNLLELAALLKKCKLLVSCDSGPVHLAACVNTPVLAIFRNDMPGKGPKRWGPWGKGHVVISKSSLNDITVDEVFNKAKERFGIQ